MTAAAIDLQGLMPPGAVAVEAIAEDWTAALWPEEEPTVARAVEKRRREFAAGRSCARRALALVGAPEVALPSLPDRVPRWPDGFVGSISHTTGWCAAAAAPGDRLRAIGIDGECMARKGVRDVLPVITRPHELAWLDGLAERDRLIAGTILFSAKEAFFKCQYTLTRRWLEFDEVELELSADEPDWRSGRFSASLHARPPLVLPPLAGRFAVAGDLVVTVAHIEV